MGEHHFYLKEIYCHHYLLSTAPFRGHHSESSHSIPSILFGHTNTFHLLPNLTTDHSVICNYHSPQRLLPDHSG